MHTAFADFVRKENQVSEDNRFNADAIKERFQKDLDDLYKHVSEWLKDYTDQGTVQIDFQPFDLHESTIGSYQVRKATIHIGNKKVEMIPVGATLVGALGRVDMIGEVGSAMLLVVSKEAKRPTIVSREFDPKKQKPPVLKSKGIPHAEWVWKVASPPPRIRFTDLSETSFLQLVMEVSNGEAD